MNEPIRNFLLALLATAAFSNGANAQVKYTANTLTLADGQASAKAFISDMEWLAGSWFGSGLDGVTEEIWSRPQGGVMMGTYRLIVKEKPVFYEMMLLLEHEGSLMLRVKHFNPDFVGWEEKDKSVDFRFVSKQGNRINFSGLAFELLDSQNLRIYLAIKQKDGGLCEEIFKMKRN